MTNQKHRTLKERVGRAIIQESIFRIESAIIIAITLLASAFLPNIVPFIPWWGWLLFGLISESVLIYSSLTDPEFGKQVASKLLHQEFKPERLRDKELQTKINKALDYRSRIEQAVREQDNSLIKDEFTQTAEQMDEWLENIYDLARRIDRYRSERKVLLRDKEQATQRLADLRQKLKEETDDSVKRQINLSISSTERQLDTLERLDNTIERAELQLENSLTNLGTIYSQTMLVNVKDIDSGRARRLRQEISEEVVELNDILLAMDEVYQNESHELAS
ncbi:MAG: hypothetical protein Kow0080_14530 [Candidatus Promineifilaceae bacterium]